MAEISQSVLDSFVKTVNNHPDASDETLLGAFPELNNNGELLKSARSYAKTVTLHPDASEEDIHNAFPEFFGSAAPAPEKKKSSAISFLSAFNQNYAGGQKVISEQLTPEAIQQSASREKAEREKRSSNNWTAADYVSKAQYEQAQKEAMFGTQGGLSIGVDEQGMPSVTFQEAKPANLMAGLSDKENIEKTPQVAAKKAKVKPFVLRDNESEDNIITNIYEAWTTNTEAGRQAVAEAEDLVADNNARIEASFNQDIADLQSRLNSGYITPEQAKKEQKDLIDKYAKESQEFAADVDRNVWQAAYEANKDQVDWQIRNLGMRRTDESSSQLRPAIESNLKRIDEEVNKEAAKYHGGGMGAASSSAAAQGRIIALRSNTDWTKYQIAKRMLDKADEISSAVKEGKGFGSGFAEGFTDISTWDFGLSELTEAINLRDIIEKNERWEKNHKDSDKLTDAEQAVLDAAAIYTMAQAYNADLLGRLYKAGKASAESVPFMLEFAAMPLGSIQNATAKGIFRLLSRKGSEQVIKRGWAYAGKRFAGLTAGNLAGALVMTGTFGVPKITAGTIEGMTGRLQADFDEEGNVKFDGIKEGTKKSLGKSLKDEMVKQYMENFSEMAFSAFKPFEMLGYTKGWFTKLGSTEIGAAINEIRRSQVGQFAKRAQWSGVFGEDMEEQLNNLSNLAFVSDINTAKEASLDLDGQIDTFLALAPTSLAFGLTGVTAHYAPIAANAAKLRASLATEAEKKMFDTIMRESRHGDFALKAHDLVRAVVTNNKLTPEGKQTQLELIFAKYHADLSEKSEKAVDNYVEEIYGKNFDRASVEGMVNAKDHQIHTGVDVNGKRFYITDGYVKTKEVDGKQVVDTEGSDKEFTIRYIYEDGNLGEPQKVKNDFAYGEIFTSVPSHRRALIVAEAKAKLLGKKTFELDGKTYSVSSLEEVPSDQEEQEEDEPQPEITQEEEQQMEGVLPKGVAPIDTKKRIVTPTTKMKVNINGIPTDVYLTSSGHYMNEDGTINVYDENGHIDKAAYKRIHIQNSRMQEVKDTAEEKTKEIYLAAINNELRKQRADAIKKAREEEAAAKKEAEAKAQQQQAIDAADEEKAKIRKDAQYKKNGEIDNNNSTPEQNVVYLLDNASAEETAEIVRDRILELHAEIAKSNNAIDKWKLRKKIDGYYAAVGKWINKEVADAMKADVEKTINAEPQAPVAQSPKQKAPKKPKAEKKEAPQSKTVDGWRDGMDVWADNVYLTKDNHGHLKLVEKDSAPKRAKTKHKIYLKNADGSFSGPYLLWSSMSPSKAQTNVTYVDENGISHTIDRSDVYVQNANGEYEQLKATSRTHVTSFKTILDAKKNIAGEIVSIADFLKPVKITVNVTKKVRGKEKEVGQIKYLSGYEAFLQRLEKKGLTDEQLEEAKQQTVEAIRDWINQWNSYAKHLLETYSMDEKDVQRVRAKNLWIWRGVRDRYAKLGDLKKVDELQKQIAEQIEPTVHAVIDTDASLRSSSFNNPLYQLALMIDVAKSMGAIQEEIDTELPRHIEIVSNSKVITPKDIEAAREEYAKLKDPIKKEKLEKKFPEVKNDLPALTRFDITLEGEGARTPEVTNKAYDSSLQETYREMAKALKKQEEEKAGGEALTQLKETLNKVVEAMAANDTKAIEELNKEVESIMSAHRNERAFINAYNEVQRRVNQILREANPEEARKVDAIATVRRLLEQLEAAENEREELRNTENARSSLTDRIERMSNKIATIKEQIAREKAAHPELAEQFGLEEDRAEALRIYHAREKEVKRLEAEVKRLNTILTTVPKTREDQEELNEATEKIDDATEALKNAQEQLKDIKKRIPPRFTESYVGLNMTVQPEMSIVEENTMSRESKEARLAFGALRQVMANIKGVKVHYIGSQEDARKEIAKLHGVPELQEFENSKGTILGWAIGNEIYLTDEGLNSETPIHEYTHLWVKSLRTENPKAWKKIVNLCKKNTSLWNKVKNDPNYANLTSDDEIASEVLSRYSGKRGSARLLEEAKAIVEEKGLSNEKMVNSLVNRMKSVLKEFWDTIKGLFNIRTMDDVSDWVLKDLFDGKRLNLSEEEMQLIKQRAIEDGTFMKAPNGQPTQLTERQWLQVRTEAFKEWFGDWTKITFDAEGRIHIPDDVSKVVDKNGEPRVVYHGSERAGFYIFDPKDEQEEYYIDGSVDVSLVSNGRGTFTTPQKPVAGVYARVFGDELENSEAKIGEAPHRGIYSLFANIKNPLIVDCTDDNGMPSRWFEIPSGKYRVVGEEMATQYFETYEEAAEWMYEHGFGVESENEGWETEPELLPVYYTTDECVEMARSEGYDGVVFLNIIDGTDSAIMKAQGEGELYNKPHQVITTLVPNQLKSATQNKGTFEMENDRIQFSYDDKESGYTDENKENEVNDLQQDLIRKTVDATIKREKEISAIERIITKCLDRTEGFRRMQKSINSYRRLVGLPPLDADKFDIRTKYESMMSVARNRRVEFENGEGYRFDKAYRDMSKAIEKSEFYSKYKKERCPYGTLDDSLRDDTVLTPLQLLERYLMAVDNIENRYPAEKERGIEELAKRLTGQHIDAPMTREEALAIVQKFVEEFEDTFGKRTDAKSQVGMLWASIKEVTDLALKYNREGRNLSEEKYKELSAKRFYVPQRGDFHNDEETDVDIEDNTQVQGRGVQISSMKKAKGSKSLGSAPIATMIRDVTEAIQKGELNKVKIAMYDMLRENIDWCNGRMRVPSKVAFEKKVTTDEKGNEKITYERVKESEAEAKKMTAEEINARQQEIEKRLAEIESLDKSGLSKEEQTAMLNEYEALQEEHNVLDARLEFALTARDTRDLYEEERSHYKKDKQILTVPLLLDGVQCEMEFPKRYEYVAKALNGISDKRLGDTLFKVVNGYVSAQFTVNNPTFWAVNFVRDIPFVVQKGTIEYGPEFTARFIANFVVCKFAVGRYAFANNSLWMGKVWSATSDRGKIHILFQQFLQAGGNTGYSSLEDLEKFKAHVKDLVPGLKWKDMTNVERTKKVLKTIAKPIDTAIGFLEMRPLANCMNEYSELITRFAIYKSIIDMGMGQNEAVKAAHNLSVNFNRQGYGAPLINFFNSMSMFANATIQGASGFYRAFSDDDVIYKKDSLKWNKNGEWKFASDNDNMKIMRTTTLFMLVPYVLGAMNALLNPDDDDYKVSDWDRDNYVIFGNARIPLNEQLKPLWVMGVNAAMVATGKRTMEEARTSVINSFVRNLIPIAPNISDFVINLNDVNSNWAQKLLTLILPTSIQSITDVANNQNFLGSKLRQDIEGIPEYMTAQSESAWYKDASYLMYKMGHGRTEFGRDMGSTYLSEDYDYRKIGRFWNTNPKELRAAAFIIPQGAVDVWATSYAIDKDRRKDNKFGTSIRLKDIPLVNRFWREQNPDVNYYYITQEAKKIVGELKSPMKRLIDIAKGVEAKSEMANMDAQRLASEGNNKAAEDIAKVAKGHHEKALGLEQELESNFGQEDANATTRAALEILLKAYDQVNMRKTALRLHLQDSQKFENFLVNNEPKTVEECDEMRRKICLSISYLVNMHKGLSTTQGEEASWNELSEGVNDTLNDLEE